MTKEEIDKLSRYGEGRIPFKEIELEDIPQHVQVPIMVPQILVTENSGVCSVIWKAFENVINKVSRKKYVNDKMMKKAMNVMLYNELRKNKLIIKGE
jgi:hypothetical protein